MLFPNGADVRAMSLQSCLTLCDPVDYSPPGSSVHGDSPGKNTGEGGHALAPGTHFMDDNFSTDWEEGGDGLRMIQVHDIYCVLYFHYYYIGSTSGHQALHPGGWDPCCKAHQCHLLQEDLPDPWPPHMRNRLAPFPQPAPMPPPQSALEKTGIQHSCGSHP